MKKIIFATATLALLFPPLAHANTGHIIIEPCQRHASWKECALITIHGDIVYGDGAEFITRTEEIRTAIVNLAGSDGGSTFGGFLIGERIHEKGYATNLVRNTNCASACAFIWMAGADRRMDGNTVLLFHTPLNVADPAHADGVTSMMAGMYMDKLGYTYSDLMRMFGHGPDDWHVTINDKNNKISRINLTRQQYEAALARQAKDAIKD